MNIFFVLCMLSNKKLTEKLTVTKQLTLIIAVCPPLYILSKWRTSELIKVIYRSKMCYRFSQNGGHCSCQTFLGCEISFMFMIRFKDNQRLNHLFIKVLLHGRYSVTGHWQLDCVFNDLSRLASNKHQTSVSLALVRGFHRGRMVPPPPPPCILPQKASNTGSVSMLWSRCKLHLQRFSVLESKNSIGFKLWCNDPRNGDLH